MTKQTESIDDLRQQRDEARAEAADLRRQLEQAQAVKISDLESCWPTANMAAHADAANARNEAADLRRQLETAQLQRDAAQDAVVGLQGELAALRALLETERHRSAIAKATAKATAADLRHQLAKEREQWRQLAQDTQYYIEDAAGLRRQLAEAQAERTEVLRALDIVIAERDVAHAEIDDLRKRLTAVPVACIRNVVLDVANNAEWRMVREWLKTYDSPATGEGE